MAKKTIEPGGVDEYIATCPEEVQNQLEKIRATIRSVAPGATETVGYFHFPGYSYQGHDYNYNGMFAWFSYKKPYVRLHVRPSVIREHAGELTNYTTTTSIISFPEDDEIPASLVKKMVKASLAAMKGATE